MRQQQVRKTRTVPKMDETQRQYEEAEFNDRLQRARRAARSARRTSLAAGRLVAEMDRMTTHG